MTEQLIARSSLIIYADNDKGRQLLQHTAMEQSANMMERSMATLSIASNILESQCPLTIPGTGRSAVDVHNAHRMRLREPRSPLPVVVRLASPTQADLYWQFRRSQMRTATAAESGLVYQEVAHSSREED